MQSLSQDDARRRADLLSVQRYDVSLDLSGDDKTFTSTTVIGFTANAATDTFVDVHPKQLLGARLNGTALNVDRLEDGRLPLAVASGDNELVVDAVMGYRNDGEGMHRMVDPADGKHYTYAMSFLDAAPSIFACFDQPDLKAPYTVHAVTPTDWVVVGNGRAEQVEPGRWELATTQPLSTYFVTLVAGPYHVIRSDHDGIALGLECRASLAPHLDREADELFTITRQSFDELHRLFGSRYAFGDYHQAFVPEFNAGAMENPGCVTFYDPLVFTSKVTRSQRAVRASTIAHEMAHQWFGDLVTMRWWDDLWLNESFAEFMGNRITAEVTEFSDIRVESAFGRKYWGLEADQRPSTHPVAGNGARDAATALQNFDGISYVKGAAVLGQLAATLGDEVFFAGAREHFNRHRYSNATLSDLVSAWESVGAGDLGEWSRAWLQTAGPDLIQLDRSAERAVIRKTTPADHPAERQHAMSFASVDGPAGWVTDRVVLESELVLPAATGARPVILDPADQTWARFTVDDLTLEALPRLLPAMSDPLMRASLWNAVRDGVRNALIDPAEALGLVEVALPTEDQDSGVAALGSFSIERLCGRLLPDGAAGLRRVCAAATTRLKTAEPGSGVQLAAMRTVVASCSDHDVLRGWLSAVDVPAGLEVDLDLRWKILIRLSTLGAVERKELQEWLERETTAQSEVDLIRCLCSLPDEQAKAYGWDRFSGAVEASNHQLEAAGRGFWHRGQEAVTGPYLNRYFAEVADTVRIRTGWNLTSTAQAFFPRESLTKATLDAAERLLADPTLNPSLGRVLADESDDLTRGLRVRQTFAR